MDYFSATSEEEIVQCVDQGLDINRKVRMGFDFCTALQCAIETDDLDKCKLLIKYGATPKPWYVTIAAQRGCYDIFILLFDQGTIDQRDVNMGTALEACCLGGHVDICDFLLVKGAKITSSVINNACISGSIDIIDRLLTHKFEYTENPFNSALFICGTHNYVEIMDRLFIYGFNINCRSYDGKTPLINAVTSRSIVAVKRLVDYGADKSLVDRYGKSAYDYAFEMKISELTEVLAF